MINCPYINSNIINSLIVIFSLFDLLLFTENLIYLQHFNKFHQLILTITLYFVQYVTSVEEYQNTQKKTLGLLYSESWSSLSHRGLEHLPVE